MAPDNALSPMSRSRERVYGSRSVAGLTSHHIEDLYQFPASRPRQDIFQRIGIQYAEERLQGFGEQRL